VVANEDDVVFSANLMKGHQKGAKMVVTLYCFSRVPCLNFKMLLHAMVGQNRKKFNVENNTLFYFICDVRI
jgi:hypothetical protein